MRILITNDDGVHAEGLAALERIAAELSDDVWVAAPEFEQSGASRSLTLAEPLRVREAGPRRFAIAGTPTDCVSLAVLDLIEGRRPDLVLSGVNRGQNLAEDVTMSGTVAGAIEGMALGIPSIALSQGADADGEVRFGTSERHGAGVIRRLLAAGWPAGVVLNVNFPADDPGGGAQLAVTRQGFRDVRTRFTERRTDLRGRPYYWQGFRRLASQPEAGTDLRAFYDGIISVTPLHIDLTHAATLAALGRTMALQAEAGPRPADRRAGP